MHKIKNIINRGVKEWRRLAASLLLSIFVFQVGSPTALALWEIRTAQAADLGGTISSAISSVFGLSGDILEKFDTKSAAQNYQATAKGKNQFELVAILVDENITLNNRQYDGLMSTHNPTVPNTSEQNYRKLTDQTLIGRIDRYARDLQGINPVKNSTPYTKTVILKVSPNQPTEEIAAALEKLYRDGDGTRAEENRLKGIVLFGDVPLPVVNKNGNRFVSLFPYTDFDNPYYVYDPATGDFAISAETDRPGAEIWHGVIKPPVGGEDGNKLLAEYLDKNHLFKIGEPGYSDFDKKIFYSDFNKEFHLMGEEGLPSYFSYLKYWEDISYFRFNKTWANKLMSESPIGQPEGDGFDNDNDGKIDEDPVNGYDDDGDGEPGSPLHGLINRLDDDGDGEIDNDEEGVWGFCSPIPPTGPTKLENCQMPGMPYKTNDFYNTKPGSFYKVIDDVNNNAADDLRVDEGIDEDPGDAFLGVDNDRDGRVDEDTSQDNDADGDLKSDEDGPGDMNGDGCPGQCGVDEDNDSIDGDSDFWPKGYEKEYGSLSLGLGGLGDLIDATASGDVKAAFASLKSPTDPESPWDFPMITFSPPIGPPFPFPRFMPWPNADEWVDEGSISDDDEDGYVDEDGTDDNDNDQDGLFDEDPGDALGTAGKTGEDPFEKLPDIRSKDVIMNFFKKYNELFDKFYADINTWVDATGRYDQSYIDSNGDQQSDLVTFPFLIAAKDEFTRIYLKAVNDALEAQVDKYVYQLQYDIQLVKGSTLSGYVILPDANGIFPPGAKLRFNNIDFINFGYSNAQFESSLEAFLTSFILLAPNMVDQALELFLQTLKGPVDATTPIFINGKSIDSITNIQECSLYRGSEGDENSQMVYANTVFDPTANENGDPPPQMPEEWNSRSDEFRIGDEDNDYHGAYWWWGHDPASPMVQWMEKQRLLNQAFAGCFSGNSNDASRCFPTLATRYIFSLGGTKQVTNVPKSAVSHQACFDLKEKNGYDAFALDANIYLKKMLGVMTEPEKIALDPEKPPASAAYRAPKFINLIDFISNPPVGFEVSPENPAIPIPQALLDNAANDPTLGVLDVHLEQVLTAYMGGNREDDNQNGVIDDVAEAALQFFAINPADGQPNWLQVGEQILQTSRFDEASANPDQKPLLFNNGIIPGTKTVEVRVSPIPGKTISSLVYHKEPTVDTVQAQTYELKRDAKGNFIEDATLTPEDKKTLGKYEVVTTTRPDPEDPTQTKTIEVKTETRNTSSIPIDSPRYVSFRDANGDYQEIVYPNAFRAGSLAEFKQQLVDLENELQSIPINPLYAGQGPNSANGLLTGAVQDFLDQDVVNTQSDSVSVASGKKLADALDWKGMDLDQKHLYALSHYWGSALSPYTPLSESANGYEILYLNSTGNASDFAMKFNKEIPPAAPQDDVEKVDCSLAVNSYKKACQDEAAGGEGGGGGGGGTGGDGGDAAGEEADMTPVFITEWFQALEKWAEETVEIINGKGAILACPAGGFTDLPNSGPVDTTVYNPVTVINTPIDLDGNGIPDQSDKTVKLSIRLADPAKNTLRAGTSDQTKVIVEGLDKDNNLNSSDSSSAVRLTLSTVTGTSPVASLLGPDTMILAGGQATYILKAGENSGTVSLQASLVADAKIKTDQLPVNVSDEVIKLMSYRRFSSYQFIAGAQAGYQIMDGNGNPIADVDPKTGYINILDTNYELGVLPASGTRPLRQAVVAKADGKVYAILYFVLGDTNSSAITIDAPSQDYQQTYQNLRGLHIKDLSASDNLSLKNISDEEALKGDYYIVDSLTAGNQGRVGVVDKRGNVFTDLKMRVKTGPNDGPVVFVIENAQGQPAFEFYIGSKFELITQLQYEEAQDLFAGLYGVLVAKAKGWEIFDGWIGSMEIAKAHAQTPAPTAGPAEPTGLIVPDTDSDGLNDLEELVIGTGISKADTNENGKSDLDDLENGIDPRLSGKALFSDLQPAQEGFTEILKLLRRGIVMTDAQGRVRPKENITREEFIKLDLGGICIICDRFSDKVKESVWKVYSSSPFPDPDIAEEYKYCVAEGKNRGIISGYKAFENVGYYVPKAYISRAEATKVILETARQQIESFPDFIINENLTGKPWYYNYVLTAQKEGIYPKGKFPALDKPGADGAKEFQAYFDSQIILAEQGLPGGIANSQFLLWLNQPITRVEFAIMVFRFSDKYNCLTNDLDGDGLPDNLEKYVYGTNAGEADTDGGGVPDGAEVLRGSDPLNAADDFPVTPEPVTPVIADPNEDPDQDGLTNSLESEIGTDPEDADTDDGGVKDGTEYLLGMDPLDAGDDQNFGAGTGLEDDGDGAYLSGLEIAPKTIYQLPEDGSDEANNINTEETDRVPADGESVLYVRATLYDQEGNILADDNKSVINFGFKNRDDGKYATLSPLSVQVKNGVAETTLTSKIKTGLPIVIASVDGKYIPSDERMIEVYALEPASARISATSPIIPSGGKSTTALTAEMRDKNGNLADSGNYTATFDVVPSGTALAKLDDGQDEDSDLPGIQMSSITGEYKLKLTSGQSPEELKVRINYQDPLQVAEANVNNSTADLLNLGAQIFKPASITAETNVSTRNDLRIVMRPKKLELKADQKDNTEIEVAVEDSTGRTLEGFSGEVSLKLLNDKMGKLLANGQPVASLKLPLENGTAKFKVQSSLKAGDLVVMASVEALPMISLTLNSYAYKPTQIVLETADLEVDNDPAKIYTVKAKLYDSAGNFVKRDNTTLLNFSVDPESATFGSIVSAKQVKAVKGEAEFAFKTGTLTGPLRLRARGNDILDGVLEINVVHNFQGKDFREIKPKILYADLLGAAYGEVTDNDYLGGWFVFSGKVESAVTLLTDPKPKVRLAETTPAGKLLINDSGNLEASLVATGADAAPVKQVLSDLTSNKEIFEVSIVPKPQSQIKEALSTGEVAGKQETVNVINLVPGDQHYSLVVEDNNASLLKDGQLIAEIGKDAKIRLFSATVSLAMDEDFSTSAVSWNVLDLGKPVLRVVVGTGDLGDVKLLESDDKVPNSPGVYLKKLATLPSRSYIQSFSGNSSAAARGYYYTDDTQTLDKTQAPGLNYLSLEAAAEEDGIGLRGDNKNVLLFSAGNSVGESNLPYASDGGVVLGDPTVRLDNQREPGTLAKLYSATGYTRDVGKMLLAGNVTVKEISPIDYDNDGDKDLFVSYADGKIRLLENLNGGKGFIDRNIFLDFPTGILSQAVLDINDDGWEDLVVATADSCKVGEICVNAYLNDHTNFVRRNLNLEGYTAKNKVYMLRAADMNQDAYQDLVISDDTGNIKVFYGHNGQLNKKGSVVGNLGVKINQTDNLKEEVFVYYQNMAGNLPGANDDKYFEEVVLKGKNAAEDKTLQIKSLFIDALLGVSSSKKAQDLTPPANVLAEGDKLQYTITLVNSANVEIKNLLVGDIVPENVELETESLKCENCTGNLSVVETGMSLRPYLIAGVDLPAKATRTLTYTVTVKTLPKVKIAVGQNLSSLYPVKDGYPDIAATPEGNPTGRIVYYYSIGKNNSNGEMTYGEFVSPDPELSNAIGYNPVKDPDTGKTLGLDLSLFEQKNANGVPVAVQHFLDYGTFPGMTSVSGGGGGGGEGDSISALPGVGGAYDGLGKALDGAAEDLENAISALTCSGGCIPMPINFAFLATGPINVMGVPVGYDPGFPIFGWGMPPPFVCSGPMCYASQGGRIYLSPTLTGKIAMATCLGPYPVGFGPVPGNCFTIVLPIDPFAGLCEDIAGAIEGTLGAANNIIADSSGTIGTSNDGSLADTPTSDGKNYTGGFEAASSMGNYGFKVNAKTNIRMPGFPSVLTDWLDNQSSEIINKLTDLPDIYILLPDVISAFQPSSDGKSESAKGAEEVTDGAKNVSKEAVSPKGLRGVLNEINKIPIISIKPQEVIIKIPSLTPGEIDRFVNDAKQWVQDEKYELERVLNIWKCGPFKEMVPDPNGGQNPDGTPKMVPGYEDGTDADGQPIIVYGDRPYNQVCDMITLDMTKLIQSVEKNIEIIEGYKQIPRQILAWKNMLTKYVSQIICYIDAIVQFFVGNISKWLTQASAWVDAVATLIETVATWKLMFDLVIDYQTSCDKCTSSRFSLLELVLKLFAFIPSPPIIPFPKLPDIYLDFSQVQMGITILWPDLKFRPEKIVLPRLPRIVLPELPVYNFTLPAIPLLPDLSFALPELPDLPPLILPALPNLPPPPKIPKLPGAVQATISILKKIFKILCLIKKGFIPTSETVLKTTIEHMTERGLDPLLPFDLGLAFQLPGISYNYVERIVLTVKINLNKALEFSTIYDVVKQMGDKLNVISTNFSAAANSVSKGLETAAANQAATLNEGMADSVPEGNAGEKPLLNWLPPEISRELGFDPQLASEFSAFSPELAEAISGLNTANKELAATMEQYQEMIASDFQDIYLVAGTNTIRPDDAAANRTLEELENFDYEGVMLALGNSGNNFQETKQLANLRQNLLAYAKENARLDSEAMQTNDLEKFATLMASAPSLADVLTESGYKENTMWAEAKKLYAAIPSLDDLTNSGGLPSSMQNKPVTKGMFIYNENQQINEKLINYEEDLSLTNTMNFIDVDADNDKDLVYSYGANVYLKENYSKPAGKGQVYGGLPRYHDINDYVPAKSALREFSTKYNGNRNVDLMWKAATGSGTAGYEILISKKLGGSSYDGVTNNLNGDDIYKVVLLNPADVVGSLSANSFPQVENSYGFPASRVHELVATEVKGVVRFDGPEQKNMVPGGERLTMSGGQEIFAAADSVLKVFVNGEEMAPKKMSARELIILPSGFGGQLELILESGSVTITDPNSELNSQQLLPGGKIEADTIYYSVNDGSALIKLPGNTYTRVDAGQKMEIRALDNPSRPATSLEFENGFYYAVVRSFDRIGFRSLQSQSVLLSPNVCSDRQDPFPVAGPRERDVAIFKSLKIDAAKSFDSFGKIQSFYLDTDLESDSNGDGDKTNDKNLGRDVNPLIDSDGNGIIFDDLDSPILYAGPYKDLQPRKVMLNVVDESGNSGQQEITINIYVPQIFLDEESASLEIVQNGQGMTVSGSLEPPESEMPIAIFRDRAGVKDLLRSPSADVFGKYITNANGRFSIDDLNLKDTVVIRDKDGNIIAEIDPATGRIVLKNPLYSVEALPAEEPLLPTRVVVKDPNGKIITTLFIVSNSAADVVLDAADANYSAAAVELFQGVHIKDLTDPAAATESGYEMRAVGADDERFAGAVEIVEKGTGSATAKRAALLDKAGNFYIYDNKLKLNLKSAADLKEPMIFQVIKQSQGASEQTVIGEFHITFSTDRPITILDPSQFKLFTEESQAKGPKFDTDKDGIPDQWEQQYGLDFQNPADATEDPDEDGLTNLDEYLAGTDPFQADSDGDGYNDGFEKIFGQDPNSKAASPFTDVTPDTPYYTSIMNFFQRGILAGIPAGNQLKFGFEEPIQRAEFAKVMLDTFCIVPRPEAYESPGVFTDIPFSDQGNPWYFPATKEAYFQGFITGYRGQIDVRTGRTPFVPEATISMAEAVKIILEALEREGVISLADLTVTEPYYQAFMQVALDLRPYVSEGFSLKSTYLLTPDEALSPETELSRGEFIKLADRVLLAYDCSTIDTDGDGMPDFWEKQNGLNHLDASDADDDPDKDGLVNLEEYKYGTDPWVADTDGGGVGDGEEVLKRQTNPLDPADDFSDIDGDGLSDLDEVNKYGTKPDEADTDGGGVNDGDEVLNNGTDPLNPLDDKDTDGDGLGDGEEQLIHKTDYLNPDTDGGGIKDGAEVFRGTDPLEPKDDLIDPKQDLEDGVYVIPADCFTCPCPAAIDHTADLIPGDNILGIISNHDNSQIFSQSNLVTIKEVINNQQP